MTLNLSVSDDQFGQYVGRTMAIADRLGKSLPFDDIMGALQCLHDKKFRFDDGVLVLDAPKPVVEPAKFALLVDLGTIVVPDDYNPASYLSSFEKKNRKKFYYFNDDITDANFSNPSRVLKPGDKLRVKAWKQIVPGTTTSEDRMAFLATQNSVHVGAQGAGLVFEQKRNQLPKGYWYCSFDEKDRLWEDAGGYHRVPGVSASSGGGFGFGLGDFEKPWYDGSAVLSFSDEAL